MDNTFGSPFHPVAETLYNRAHPLSSLARPTPVRDAFGFRRTDPLTTFRRLVTVHLRAFEAERAGKWERADFYWRELWGLIGKTPADDVCWAAGRDALAPAFGDASPSEFRGRFLRGVVVASHAQFFSAQVEAGSDPLERPRIHLQGIADAYRVLSPDIEEEALLIDALAAMALARYGDQRQEDAENFCLLLIEHFPRQTQFVEIALATLIRRTRRIESADLTRPLVLNAAINCAEDLNQKFPSNFSSYQALGLLYHEETIALADAGEISAALVASRKAEAFGGGHAVLTETRQQLEAAMRMIQQQAAKIGEELRKTHGELSEKGRQLVRNASEGNSRAELWNKSDEADEIRSGRTKARDVPVREMGAVQIAVPGIALESATRVSGDADALDILASPTGLQMRMQVAAASLAAVLVAGVLTQDTWHEYTRSRALDKVQTARAANDDVATLNALADFFGAQTYRGDAAETALIPVYNDTFVRWFTSRVDDLSAEDRRVLQNYKQLIVDRGLDSPEVLQ